MKKLSLSRRADLVQQWCFKGRPVRRPGSTMCGDFLFISSLWQSQLICYLVIYLLFIPFVGYILSTRLVLLLPHAIYRTVFYRLANNSCRNEGAAHLALLTLTGQISPRSNLWISTFKVNRTLVKEPGAIWESFVQEDSPSSWTLVQPTAHLLQEGLL